MNKLNVFVFAMLLLFSFTFAVNMGKGNDKAIGVEDTQIVYKIDKKNLSKNITAEKLNNKKYKIKIDNKEMFSFEVLNNINYLTNRFNDCTGGYTCQFRMNISTAEAIQFDNAMFEGAWKDGDAHVQKVYYDKEIIVSGEYTDMNGTTHSYSYNTTIQETNFTTLKKKKNEYEIVTILFARDELKEVDIFPKILGYEFEDWSIWGVGGVEYTVLINGTNYTIHEYKNSGTFNNTLEIENAAILIVAGGAGCNATNRGGCGAGGLQIINSTTIPVNNYTVTVGAGGTDGNGGDSVFLNWTSIGGGRGGATASDGAAGGSGGAGGPNNVVGPTQTGGAGTTGQGYAGGNTPGLGNSPTGGGGGANETGRNGTAGPIAGNGGRGKLINITGNATIYSEGGGGGVEAAGTVGVGPTGCGGTGANGGGGATAGTPNTGCGGGGAPSTQSGGDGGSGIVIIRYETPTALTPFSSPQITPAEAYTNTTLHFNTTFGDLSTQNITAINWTIWNGTTAYRVNTSSGLWANESVSLWNESGFAKGAVLIFQVAGQLTNGTWINATNSSSVTILNSNLTISAFDFTTNGSAYINGEVEGNVTVTDIDTADTLTLKWNFFKNGANQTALAGTKTVTSGAVTTINANQSLYTSGDNWSLRVWATDATNTTPYNDSANTTIQNYYSNILTNYTESQYDIYNYVHYLNYTTAATNTTTGVFFNSKYKSASCSGTTNKVCSVNITPLIITAPINYTIVWQINISTPIVYSQNTSYNITVNPGGLYLCNASLTNDALEFMSFDGVNSSALNTTMTTVLYITTQNGTLKPISFTQINQTSYVCIAPYNATFNITTLEQYTATSYNPVSLTRALSVSNVSQNLSAYLYTSAVSVATQLKVILDPNTPLEDVSISVQRFVAPSNYSDFTRCDTTSSGTCTVFLVPNIEFYYYILNISGTIYNFGAEVLTCDAAASTCYRTFTIGAVESPPLISGNITGSCTYDNSTNLLECTGQDLGETVSGFYLISQQIGNSTLVCNEDSTSNPATLSCTIPNINATFGYSFYAQDSSNNFYPLSSGLIYDLYTFRDRFGSDAWLAALVLMMFLIGAFSKNLWLSLLAGAIGLGIGILVGFLPGGVMVAVLIAVAILVIIVGRKLVV